MLKKVLVKAAAVVLAGTMVFSFAGCGKKIDTMKHVKDTGKLVMGTSADYPPYEFHKQIDGEDKVVGFDIAIANEIAKELGVKLEIKEMEFGTLLGALKTGKVDMVLAGMTPDKKRKKEVDFSDIYYMAKQGILVKAEKKDSIKTLEDLKGKKVGAQQGSIQEEIAKEQIAGAELKTLGNVGDLILELQNNKVDALVMELPVAELYVSQNADLAVSDAKVKDEDGGSAVGVAKGNQEFVDAVNKVIDRLNAEKAIEKFVTEAIQLSGNE